MARTAALLFVAAAMAEAEPPAKPELFAHGGFLRAGADEGWLSAGGSFGGTVVVPFASRFALDVDVAAASRTVSNFGSDFRWRRTLLSPSVVWRKGSERAYFFLGGGVGGQFETTRFRSPERIAEAPNARPTILFRTGGTGVIRGRLLWRGDLLWAHSHILPNLSLRAGIGYRF
ncbi:MAG: hypothetical protein R2729_27140 [Bryobacteraceae bacterium]